MRCLLQFPAFFEVSTWNERRKSVFQFSEAALYIFAKYVKTCCCTIMEAQEIISSSWWVNWFYWLGFMRTQCYVKLDAHNLVLWCNHKGFFFFLYFLNHRGLGSVVLLFFNHDHLKHVSVFFWTDDPIGHLIFNCIVDMLQSDSLLGLQLYIDDALVSWTGDLKFRIRIYKKGGNWNRNLGTS